MPVTKTTIEKNVVLKDKIISVGEVKSTGELIFAGEQKSYLITNGQDKLKSLLKLNGEKLSINRDVAIDFELKDTKFSGYFSARYQTNELSELEYNVLTNELKASNPYKGMYYISVNISGDIYAKLDDNPLPKTELSKAREIRLITSKEVKSIRGQSILDKVFMLPIAITADIITSPLQLYGLTQLPPKNQIKQ